jgi:hypothetical protein
LIGRDAMHQDDHLPEQAVARRSAPGNDAAVDNRRDREITPADGSVAGSGALVCVFCALCQRWIDCYDSIPPEVARDRHGLLFH